MGMQKLAKNRIVPRLGFAHYVGGCFAQYVCVGVCVCKHETKGRWGGGGVTPCYQLCHVGANMKVEVCKF